MTKIGKPVAVILAVEDEDELERLILAYSPKFQKILQEAEQQIHEGAALSQEEFWKEMGAGQDVIGS